MINKLSTGLRENNTSFTECLVTNPRIINIGLFFKYYERIYMLRKISLSWLIGTYVYELKATSLSWPMDAYVSSEK